MKPVTSVLYTGAGPNLADSRIILSHWKEKNKARCGPSRSTTGIQSIAVIGVILLHVRIKYLKVRAWIGIVDNLSVSLLLGTYFIDHFLKGIFPSDRKIVPYHSKPVPILT